jgi:hypothetical protein
MGSCDGYEVPPSRNFGSLGGESWGALAHRATLSCREVINWRPAKTWGRSSGHRDWGGVVCRCSADVVPEPAVQVGGAHVQE